jgi:tetratricopeptide (TPR) repeat protein
VLRKNVELERANQRLDLANTDLRQANASAEYWLDRAMAAIHDYYTGVSAEALRGGALPKPLHDRLLERPKAFYEELTRRLAEKGSSSGREAELLANGRVGLGVILKELGRVDEAEAVYRDAIVSYRQLLAERPDDDRRQNLLAKALSNRGNVEQSKLQGRRALESFREALELWESITPSRRDDQTLLNIGKVEFNIAGTLDSLGRLQESVDYSRRAIDLYNSLRDRLPESRDLFDCRSSAHANLGYTLFSLGRMREAEAEQRESVRIREEALSRWPDDLEELAGLAHALNNLSGVLDKTSPPNELLALNTRLLRLWQTVVALEPNTLKFQQGYAVALCNRGVILNSLGRFEESVSVYGEGIKVIRNIRRRHSEAAEARHEGAYLQNNFGLMLGRLGRHALAAVEHEEALNEWSALGARDPDSALYREMAGWAHTNLGLSIMDAGRVEEAASHQRAAIALAKDLSTRFPENPEYRRLLGGALNNLGKTLELSGRHAEAAASYQEAIAHQRAVLSRSPKSAEALRFLRNHYIGLGRSMRALGRASDAAEAARGRAGVYPGNRLELYDVAYEFALCVPLAKRPEEAEGYARESVNALKKAVAAGWDDAAHTERDPDLAPLRGRADFRAVVAAMWNQIDRAMPADPFATAK